MDVGTAVHVGDGTTVTVSVGGIRVSAGGGAGVKVGAGAVDMRQLASNNEANTRMWMVLRMIFFNDTGIPVL